MVNQQVVVLNHTGLHTRPAKEIVKAAGAFESEIKLQKDTKIANAKSFVSVLSLGASKGTEILVSAAGEDEVKALQSIVDLFNSKFGEE
ncbi:HPr family phosphocarrier protein [Paenibacillus tyrfis]|uniref:PTS sugar transporter subunit IIA n=1 Tax=Paenibacillus tyrfis TaxID=1501230 RepID=A0A081P2R2_9BACL|nr:HPr family phosphocarrier protein [Paenibacillus tyrfis]KEQ24985.1 PTS sugar transporter subunit IIA [Paenibacillus tyrfis]